MACTFQQVFLTTSAVAPDTCLITTNRYERDFRRDSASRWVSTEGPEGVCGVLDVATLDDQGGVKWSLDQDEEAILAGYEATVQRWLAGLSEVPEVTVERM